MMELSHILNFAVLFYVASGHVAEKQGHGHHDLNVVALTEGPVNFECPPGYDLKNNRCARLLEEDMVYTCYEGQLVGEVCRVSLAAVRTCPAGYRILDNNCVSTQRTNSTLNCPPGFNLELGSSHKSESLCTRQARLPDIPSCAHGVPSPDGKCFTKQLSSAVPICEPDADLEGGMCVIRERVPCQNGSPYAGAHGGHHAKDSGHNKNLRELGQKNSSRGNKGSSSGHMKSAIPPVITISNPNPSPAYTSSVSVVEQICERKIAQAPMLECANPEARVVGQECVLDVELPAVYTAAGFITETAPIESSCPVGFTPCPTNHTHKSMSECCAFNQLDSEFTCPGLFALDNGQCISTVPAVLGCSNAVYKKHPETRTCQFIEYTEPLVTRTVSYSCYGLECNDRANAHGSANVHKNQGIRSGNKKSYNKRK